MKKILLLTLLSIAPTISAAVLNVTGNGEVQIDGKTIINTNTTIDSRGVLIDKSKLVNLHTYNPTGTKTVVLQDDNGNQYKFFYENGEYVREESWSLYNNVLVMDWSQEIINGINTRKVVDDWSQFDGSQALCSVTFSDEYITEKVEPQYVGYGDIAVSAYRMERTVGSTNCTNAYTINDKEIITDNVLRTPITTFAYDANNAECLLTDFRAPWLNKGSSQARIYCKGLGLVEFGYTGQEYRLLRVE
ncbi:hypothetical protein PVK63_12135 [Aliivibrio sp. S2TY2]|uniref:hypothetical protein n=1 Tax=unclassified Aliivibrio TaxID=2645654 RepID=UPI00237851CB|nr:MULTISPECIES: hypothetical protein [unclassified Aliivibrio]MDD9175736.1 hypothetical protein [Aliivibrio sp. S3TY1]MDD9192690.1 hypothetical protein [Aliivibrio sp. S2TY2]